MTDGYTAVCPFCHTRMVGPMQGAFVTVATCAKMLYSHMRNRCERAPAIPREHLERLAANEVKATT